MDTAQRVSYDIDVSDVEYVKHGAKPYLARVYKPRGKGPFPLIIELHGWSGNKTSTPFTTRAQHGYAVLSYSARGFHGSCGSAAFAWMRYGIL